MSDVIINIRPLQAFRAAIASGNSAPLRSAYEQWAVRYRAFTQRRFRNNNWPPLPPRTQRRRRGPQRGHTGPRQFTPLVDTGTLRAAVDPVFTGAPGQLQQIHANGVDVGFGGPSRHPRGRATVADIASFHQHGAGHLPQREILVAPSSQVLSQMAGDVDRALSKLAGQTGNH